MCLIFFHLSLSYRKITLSKVVGQTLFETTMLNEKETEGNT